MITLNPIHPHTVIATIEYSAPLGLSKKPNGPRPTFSSSQFARPKVGSNSHRKMIDVAIVEATTGTNTAVR